MICRVNKEPFYCPNCGNMLVMSSETYEDYCKNMLREKVSISCITCRTKLDKFVKKEHLSLEHWPEFYYQMALRDFYDAALDRKFECSYGDAYD